MDGFNGLQDLLPKPKGGAHGERSSGLTPPQVSQVPALPQGHTQEQVTPQRGLKGHALFIPTSPPTHLKLHDYIVEFVVASTADELTDMVFT